MISIKTTKEIELIRQSGRIVAQTIRIIGEMIRPGITTDELNKRAEEWIIKQGAVPSFKGYRGFPAATCISIDNEVVHGIPGDRKIEEGQIVSVDIGAFKNNYHGDSSYSFPVGKMQLEKKRLLEVTKRSLIEGIKQAKAGNRLHDISSAVQQTAESAGFSVVRSLVGHGIGTQLHEPPEVPNFGEPHTGIRLQTGMVLAIEPMVNQGGYEIKTLSDGWTVVTEDGLPSAHFEHTVAITDGEPEILTLEE